MIISGPYLSVCLFIKYCNLSVQTGQIQFCFVFLQYMIMLVVNVVCDRSGTYFYTHTHIAYNVQNRNLNVCKFQFCPFIVKLNPTKYTQQIISYEKNDESNKYITYYKKV